MKKFFIMAAACVIVSMGVQLLQMANLVTGGTAGLSLSLAYMLEVPFSTVFFIINLPFYILAVIRMGWKFTVSTILAVSMLSISARLLQGLPEASLHPLSGSVLGGVLIGSGLVMLFKANASLGGANILALYLQKKAGYDPGKVNFSFDIIVAALGFLKIGFWNGLCSILSIAIISIIISKAKNWINGKKADEGNIIKQAA